MPGFSGFKSTTLVGKQDLTLGTSVKKSPIGRLPIHEYAVQPSIVSTTPLSVETVSIINQIIANAQYENYQTEDQVSKYIKDKIVPVLASPEPELS